MRVDVTPLKCKLVIDVLLNVEFKIGGKKKKKKKKVKGEMIFEIIQKYYLFFLFFLFLP